MKNLDIQAAVDRREYAMVHRMELRERAGHRIYPESNTAEQERLYALSNKICAEADLALLDSIIEILGPEVPAQLWPYVVVGGVLYAPTNPMSWRRLDEPSPYQEGGAGDGGGSRGGARAPR